MSKNIGTLQNKNGDILYPSVVETITNNNGMAMKLADGTMICTKVISWTGVVDIPWGNLYETTSISLGNYAIPFISIPTISVIQCSNNGGFVEAVYGTTMTSFGICWICRGTTNVSTTYNLHCIAIGRWK